MIWLSYPLLLGILVCLFISLLAILSVVKQTMLRLKISIGLAIVIVLFVVFFQDNYIDDAYRQEWKLVKVVEIIMSVLLVVAGVTGYLRGKQSAIPDETNSIRNQPSHEDVSIVDDTEDNKDGGDNREDEGHEIIDIENEHPNEKVKENNLSQNENEDEAKTNQVEFNPEWKEKIFDVLKQKLFKFSEEEIQLILDSLDYFLINPTDDAYLPKEKISLKIRLYTQRDLLNAFGILLHLPLARGACARFMKHMFSIFDKTEESTIESKIAGDKVWPKEKIDELRKDIHP